MPRQKLKIYMFGYDGYGNATAQLNESVNAVEAKRGYNPPFWIDTRFNPYTQSIGFYGKTFSKVVGQDRYHAMKELGNANVGAHATSDRIRIQSPRAVEKLLDISLECWRRRQHVIYFCQCPEPRHCHRRKIAILLIRAAKKRGIPLQVVEWPGGEPRQHRHSLKLPRSCLKPSNLRLPGDPKPMWQYAGLAAGSRLRIYDGEGWESTVAVKAARFTRGAWRFPLVLRWKRPTADPAVIVDWRERHGYDAMTSPRWKSR